MKLESLGKVTDRSHQSCRLRLNRSLTYIARYHRAQGLILQQAACWHHLECHWQCLGDRRSLHRLCQDTHKQDMALIALILYHTITAPTMVWNAPCGTENAVERPPEKLVGNLMLSRFCWSATISVSHRITDNITHVLTSYRTPWKSAGGACVETICLVDWNRHSDPVFAADTAACTHTGTSSVLYVNCQHRTHGIQRANVEERTIGRGIGG